jgi:predicted HicB family RNase H-like nuclease
VKQHLEYKGYVGSVEVDLAENFLHGRLCFIRDVVAYRSADIASLKTAFENAVDDYLATCAELGDAPDVPCKGSFNVRVGPELHQAIALASAREDVTLNEWVRKACELRLSSGSEGSEARLPATRRVEASFEDEPYSAIGGAEWQPPTDQNRSSSIDL